LRIFSHIRSTTSRKTGCSGEQEDEVEYEGEEEDDDSFFMRTLTDLLLSMDRTFAIILQKNPNFHMKEGIHKSANNVICCSLLG
jgi:hypothetical protein